jgi:hypothetical protein
MRDGMVTGAATQGSEKVPLEELVISGNRVTWKQRITKPMKLNLRFDVSVDGDAMIGTARAGVLPASKLEGHRLI